MFNDKTTGPLHRVILEGGGAEWTDGEPIDEGDPDPAAWLLAWKEHVATLPERTGLNDIWDCLGKGHQQK